MNIEYNMIGLKEFENNICTLKRCVEALQNVELHKEGVVEYILGKYNHLKQTTIRNH